MTDFNDIENNEDLKLPLTKEKVKRERTQKQKEAFERASEKRKQNIEKKKQEKLLESARLLLQNEQIKVKENDNNIYQRLESSDTEEEIIKVSKSKTSKSKPKSKPKSVLLLVSQVRFWLPA